MTTPAPGLCSRCSRPSRHEHTQLCHACYDERARFVYWDRGEACRAKGPTKAVCLLPVEHAGHHEGNGYDQHGPIPRRWAEPKKRRSAGARVAAAATRPPSVDDGGSCV